MTDSTTEIHPTRLMPDSLRGLYDRFSACAVEAQLFLNEVSEEFEVGGAGRAAVQRERGTRN
jgi:hypothetical protein